MNKKDLLLKSQTDWTRLNEMSDDDIDFSDIPELTDEQLQSMRPVREVLVERGATYNAHRMHHVTIYHEDGSPSTHQVAPQGNAVLLDPDVQAYFPDSESVNQTLRTLIGLIPQVSSTP